MDSLLTAEINPSALRQNLQAMRRRLANGTVLAPAIKADAYGHGLRQVLPVLQEEGVERATVANLAEAIELRELGWDRPILCLAPMLSNADKNLVDERARLAIEQNISLTVTSSDEASHLAGLARKMKQAGRVEIKVDTGMGRMGVLEGQAEQNIRAIAACGNLIIDGVYTHLATADEEDLTYARQQLGRFLALRDRLRNGNGIEIDHFHAANSPALFRLPEAHLDRVRPGLTLYGYWDGPEEDRPDGLRPCLRLTGRLTAVRQLPAGHSIGYGRTFTTGRESVIGIVPIGYADGYRRQLSNDAAMTLEPVRQRGRIRVPVVGRISMDQTTVDLTEAGDVRVGDPVTIIDDDPAAPNSVEALARKLGTISYEITCLIGPRVRRVSR